METDDKNNKPHVIIYADGACRGNPGPGGWAALLRYGQHEKLLQGAASRTTNNRMELRAAIEALRALKCSCQVDFYTDSQYVKQGITEWLPRWQASGWRTADKKRVKNQDLWQALAEEAQKHRITWHWIQGHSGDPDNERVDQAAQQALNEQAASAPEDMESPPRSLSLS